VRRRIGYDRVLPTEGVLVYFVDLSKESGYGVLKVIDAKKNTESLKDAPFTKGGRFEDTKNQVYILVAYTDGVGFTVVVSGTKIQSLKDSDQDGLLDAIETILGTDPNNPDTDGDGLKDGEEINTYGTDPLNPDTDNDGLADREEVNLGTDPLKSDSDGDGLADGREVQLGTSPRMSDSDADGLLDGDEITRGTNPLKSDTDDDGLLDGKEIQRGTDPLKPDSDGDGLTDGREINLGTNPLKVDTDSDSWPDGTDFVPTSPLMPNVLILAALIVVALVLIAFRKRGKTTQAGGSTVASMTAQFCVNCGASLPVESRFCHKCGAQQ
jgi:hypothetical protein